MLNIEKAVIIDLQRKKESLIGHIWLYTIHIQKNNDEAFNIYRQYHQLHDLHEMLLKVYPKKMGYDLPEFPGWRFYESERVATERVGHLNSYLESLLETNFTSSCSTLKAFLSPSEGDLSQLETVDQKKKIEIGSPTVAEEYVVLADWDPQTSENPDALGPIKKNQKVFVIEKTMYGWWLVAPVGAVTIQPGYIPVSYLDTNMNKETPESVTCDENWEVDVTYSAQEDDELTVVAGEVLCITAKYCDGWWFGSRGKHSGMVPRAHLKPISGSNGFAVPNNKKPKRRQSKHNRSKAVENTYLRVRHDPTSENF